MSSKVVSCRNLACRLDAIWSFLFPYSLDTVCHFIVPLGSYSNPWAVFLCTQSKWRSRLSVSCNTQKKWPILSLPLTDYSHMGIFLAHNSVPNLHFPTYLFSNEKHSEGRKTSCIFILFIIFCEQKKNSS